MTRPMRTTPNPLAFDRAIKVLKDKSVNTAQASLLQVKSLNMIPDTAKNAIQQFLQQDPEFLDQSPPEANAYEGGHRVRLRQVGTRHQVR